MAVTSATAVAARRMPIEVVSTENMPEKEWLEWRRKGIGGSEVATIMGQSPFMTAKDLYRDKIGELPAVEVEDNWVAKEVGHRLESLVAEIFERKTGLRVYQIKKMFAHPDYPFMQANTDYLVETLDGQTGILEIKTSNLHAKEKWENDTIPFNYEMQGRHYMAVMDLNFCWFACLFSNNENDFVMRLLERDLDIEADMIAEEEDFWENHVLPHIEPAYTESSDLVLESIRRHYGPAVKGLPVVTLPASFKAALEEITELRKKKRDLDHQSSELDEQIKTLYGPIVDKMGTHIEAVCIDGGNKYGVSYKPRYRTGVSADSLKKLQAMNRPVYDEYVTTTESRVFAVKKESA